jgi:hypothetical protein
LDLGSPFISPNSAGAGHDELTPLLWLARFVALILVRSLRIRTKSLFSLHAEPMSTFGNSCLHLVMNYPQPAGLRSLEYRDGLSDTLTLMVTAGADVYALNDDGISVSAIANRCRNSRVWSEALETCGYDMYKVLQINNAGCGWSSAVDDLYGKLAAEMISKLLFAGYFEQREEKRKASCRVKEIFDHEDAEEWWVREMKFRKFGVSEEGQSHTNTCGMHAESDSGSDVYKEESNETEDDSEMTWNWNEDSDPGSDEEGSEEI